MGWKFRLENANIVAYLTSVVRQTPRIQIDHLKNFLKGLNEAANNNNENVFICSNPDWMGQIAQEAEKARNELNDLWVDNKRLVNFEEKLRMDLKNALDEIIASGSDEEYYKQYRNILLNEQYRNILLNEVLDEAISQVGQILQPFELERVLLGLRDLFRDYNFFALAVGSSFGELVDFASFIARDAGGNALILIPDDVDSIEQVNFLDPFPALDLLSEQENKFPGMLFWSRNGTAAFASLRNNEARFLYQRLQTARYQRNVNDILRSNQTNEKSKKILHISDLHFGQNIARNRRLLKSEIERKRDEIDRIVITGDLIDSPKDKYLDEFQDFQDDLERFVNAEVIIIPGNHDVRFWGNAAGNIGQRLQQLMNMRFNAITPAREIECVFLCFNSALSGNFARGEITAAQRADMLLEFDRQKRLNPEIENYSRIALIHHHLFPFSNEKGNSFYNAWMWLKSKISQSVVKMDGSDDFVRWCANNKIPLVLHGHEHFQWTDSENVMTDKGDYTVKTVACGASLGVHENPLTYNILTWSDASQEWKESPFEEVGDGSGFRQLSVRVNVR